MPIISTRFYTLTDVRRWEALEKQGRIGPKQAKYLAYWRELIAENPDMRTMGVSTHDARMVYERNPASPGPTFYDKRGAIVRVDWAYERIHIDYGMILMHDGAGVHVVDFDDAILEASLREYVVPPETVHLLDASALPDYIHSVGFSRRLRGALLEVSGLDKQFDVWDRLQETIKLARERQAVFLPGEHVDVLNENGETVRRFAKIMYAVLSIEPKFNRYGIEGFTADSPDGLLPVGLLRRNEIPF